MMIVMRGGKGEGRGGGNSLGGMVRMMVRVRVRVVREGERKMAQRGEERSTATKKVV